MSREQKTRKDKGEDATMRRRTVRHGQDKEAVCHEP